MSLTWTAPKVVLRGRLGSGQFDAGDDHMVGSPSVIKQQNGTRWMFYEAYGNWITPLNLFYNDDHGDTWLQPGVNVVGDPGGLRPGYTMMRHLGFAHLQDPRDPATSLALARCARVAGNREHALLVEDHDLPLRMSK